jgi:uncharacterized damage-inducible protein DinB
MLKFLMGKVEPFTRTVGRPGGTPYMYNRPIPLQQPMPNNTLIKSIEGEFRRYKALADSALEQVPEEALSQAPLGGNSLAIICWHVAGNLQSRFTDFLTTDGEKPWRQREEEFAKRSVSRGELNEKWTAGWNVLFNTLSELSDDALTQSITIRKQPMVVHEALHRALAHISYHVGQIVYVAHAICGDKWKYLSIPPGGSAAYNADPQFEKSTAHAKGLDERPR